MYVANVPLTLDTGVIFITSVRAVFVSANRWPFTPHQGQSPHSGSAIAVRVPCLLQWTHWVGSFGTEAGFLVNHPAELSVVFASGLGSWVARRLFFVPGSLVSPLGSLCPPRVLSARGSSRFPAPPLGRPGEAPCLVSLTIAIIRVGKPFVNTPIC